MDTTNKIIENFFSQAKSFDYRKSEIILRAGDNPQGVFYLKKGFVRLYTVFEDGKELTLHIFKPGSFFPMMWAIADITNGYYYEAMTDISVKRQGKEKVLNFLLENRDVLFDLTRRILIGLNGILTNIEYLLSGSAEHRVISALIICAKRFGESLKRGQVKIKLPLTHQDIANLSGITRETTSIVMSRLEKKKIVNYDKRLIVIGNLKKLEKENSFYESEHLIPAVI